MPPHIFQIPNFRFQKGLKSKIQGSIHLKSLLIGSIIVYGNLIFNGVTGQNASGCQIFTDSLTTL
jgi:hypothetical protein